ncbi:MAG: amidohydrolase [Acidobacteria bacterium]|nr:MAG: amidohydrolase [Acidobacteriota bacterium]
MQGMPVFHRGTTIEEEDTIMHRRDWLKAGAVLWGTLGSNLTAAAQNTKTKSSLIIDAHCHAGKGEAMAAPWSTFADPEVTLGRAQEAGIDKTIIFPINNPTYERANEEVAQIVKKYPGKFIGFAKHDPVTEAGKIKQLLSYEVKDLGLKGLKLHQLPTREVLDVVAALEIPILFHPPKVADYHMIAATYPQINFILAHLGSFASQNWSEHLQAIDVARRYPNVYLETSSVVFFEYLEMAARELPAEKLIFGTDGPLVDSRVELYKIRLLKLSKENEEKVLSGNILRLLPTGA